MDKYLTIYSEQLDIAFKPETLFPDKEFYIMEWLKRKLAIRKKAKKHLKGDSTVNNIVEVEFA
jgi:hypothetical protein